MQSTLRSRWLHVSCVALSLLASACSHDRTTSVAVEDTRPRIYHYVGSGASSRAERRVDSSGAETLRGDTVIHAVSEQVRLVETAAIDPSGRLVSAELSTGSPSAPRFVLDARAGTVRVLDSEGVAASWRVPADAPWVYQSSSSQDGAIVASPVSSWVALRAAGAASVVRMIEPESRRTWLVPVDQLAVATELGTTVVLGNDGIDVDDRFVFEVRLLDRGITLSRTTPCETGPS